jgi:glycosyl transferase family 2
MRSSGMSRRGLRGCLDRISTALSPTDGLSPFPVALAPRATDVPRRAIELAWARLRRRNAPHQPARLRAIANWQVQGPGPGPKRPGRPRPVIYGVMAVWNEEDIIYAAIRNLLTQGVDRVFVLDDSSDDATTYEARAAGAEVIATRNDGSFRDLDKTRKIRDQIADQTGTAGGDIWWVVADGDEFPRGPDCGSIRDLVERLPDWVDVVGSRVLEHYPCGPQDYEIRTHPLDSLPLALWYRNPYCRAKHWKHQLLRVREPGDIEPMHGHHTVATGDGRRAREYSSSLLMHHFPFRNRDRTEARLRQLVSPGGRYTASPDPFLMPRVELRLRMANYIYRGRFDLVPNPFPGERRLGLDVRDWRALLSADGRRVT